MSSINPVQRRLERFLREPPSVRNAAAVIAVAPAVITSTSVARAAREYEAAATEDAISDRELIGKRFDEPERKLDALAEANTSRRY